MHIHKINPNSQEHQNFLAQNRKDPITGDSISEGDEVVFCASCKSVFLKDTWEYLGNRHCEQMETLIKLPIQKNIHLKVVDDILFYQSLSMEGDSQTMIPSKARQIPWIKKTRLLSSYDKFQTSNVYTGLFMLILVSFCITLSFFTNNFFILIPSFVIPVLLGIIGDIHDSYYGKKIKSIHKHFLGNTFYISESSVGFSTAYAKMQYNLPLKYISKIAFYQRGKKVRDNYCQIFYEIKGIHKHEQITCYLSNTIYTNPFLLFNTLQLISKDNTIEISIESTEKDTVAIFKELNEKWNTNFAITHLYKHNTHSFFNDLFF